MSKAVGMNLKTRRVWLDAMLDQLLQTTDEAELRSFLDEYIKKELPGKEYRDKSVGIVQRIWGSIPRNRVAFRNQALTLLPRISMQEQFWLHWGMTALAYPFFRDTAEVIGRLLALQDDFTTGQVHDRMLPRWGDRITIKDAVQRLLTTLVDWEVLQPTDTKGHFILASKFTSSVPDLQLWLLEALLSASASDEIESQQLLRLPESFPFILTVGVADLRSHEHFNIHRQGLDMDMVALRKTCIAPPAVQNKSAKRAKRKIDSPGQTCLFDNKGKDVAPDHDQAQSSIHAITTTSRL